MNKYYIEFKTWLEGNVTMPGIHRVLGETNDYRNRLNLQKSIPEQTVRSVFLSFNESVIENFLREHVPACLVAVVIEAESVDLAIAELEKYLAPIEISGAVQVDLSNKDQIKEIIGDALNEHPLIN